MLIMRHIQQGVTLVELVIALVILGLLFGYGLPSFSGWIQNAQIRTAAEATQNGLQLARAEAVRRNTQVRFQFTTTMDNNCALSTTHTNWVVSLNDATGLCANLPADPPLPPAAPNPADPYIIQARPAAGGSANVVVASGQACIVYNGLGRQTFASAPCNAPPGNVAINFSSPTGTCLAAGGTLRCLRIIVSIDGQVLMCDPAVTVATDPRLCP
jgi:type IV fimbrial biogenesis protein FimT